jgi:hypothetical protein
MNLRKEILCIVVLLMVLAMSTFPAWSGGPLYVTGPSAGQPGQAYHWALNPIPYMTDRGNLGAHTNAEANDLVASSFQTWQNVGTANISFRNSGQLGIDVTASNVLTFYNGLLACSDSSQPTNAVIYDVDGSLMTALGVDNNSVLGFSSALCANDSTGIFTRGWAALNGRFIDGQPDSASHASVSLNTFQAVLTHEFGHLIGLDHSQINLNCLTQGCSATDLAGVPTMFPVLLNVSQATPKTDDIAALSTIYPASGFSSSTGRIQGRVLFSDGLTPAQGYNVIARLVGDDRRTAVSCVSGFRFTAAAGNSLVPGGNDTSVPYGSHDPSLVGYFDLPGLPSGAYTIEVEAIYDAGDMAFVGGSGVGPIGSYLNFQYKLPGNCDPQYLNNPSSSSDSCSAKSTVAVSPGAIVNTNTDVILLGTPPRYDAWEDGQ